MGNPWFQFKQFKISQDRCAMKVGTDGVILGAWTSVPVEGRVLDIGTGTGLLALMLSQRAPGIAVTAIELDPEACRQAKENVKSSRFSDRIDILCGNFLDFAAEIDYSFDLLICNPPYFESSYKPEERNRAMARHTNELTLNLLFHHAARLLTKSGKMSIIVPAGMKHVACDLGSAESLFLQRELAVIPVPGKPPKRYCLEFAFPREKTEKEKLVIEKGVRHRYSDEYVALTRDFYLGF